MWGKGTNNFLGAVLVALWLLWGVNSFGDLLIPPREPVEGEGAQTAAMSAQPKAKEEEETPLAVRLAEASVDKGETVAKKCVSCHTFEKGGQNKVGPNLYGVVGTEPAHLEGFNFSSAMKEKGGTWDFQSLDAYLENPRGFVPGTKMAFAGIKDAEDRAAVIKYLNQNSDSPQPLPEPPPQAKGGAKDSEPKSGSGDGGEQKK